MKRLTFILILLTPILSSGLFGLTVHKHDLKYLVGCFPLTEPGNIASLDGSQLEEYFLLKPIEELFMPGHGEINIRLTADSQLLYVKKLDDTEITYTSSMAYLLDSIKYLRRKIQPSPDKHWVKMKVSDLKSDINNNRIELIDYSDPDKARKRIYEYYVIVDYFGHELMYNLVSVWESLGNDSLRFIHAHHGPYNTSIFMPNLERVCLLPDSSILAAIKLEAIKISGPRYYAYKFLRGESLFELTEFYVKEWNEILDRPRQFIAYDYDLSMLNSTNFNVKEILQYKSITDVKAEHGLVAKIDSVSQHQINLWQLAKDYFEIE